MKQLKAVFFFYIRIFIPAIILSILFGFSDRYIAGSMPFLQLISIDVKPKIFSIKLFLITFFSFAFLFQYFVYEVRYRNEYYFYYNLGLSKISLWVSNLIITSTIIITTSILWIIFT